MLIKKLRKRKDKNIISDIREKGEGFFLLSSFWSSPYFFLSYFLSEKKQFVSSKIIVVLPKVDNLHLSSTITIFLKRRKNSLA
jgi:hypothetical protein